MILESIEKEILPVQREINFEIGDTVKVNYKIVEGNRERIQVYEGVVIAIDGKGLKKTFTVRKISFDVGVERVFPFYSPKIEDIKVSRKSKVRRAKLYYLRNKTGKSARLKEKVRKKAVKNGPAVSAPVKNSESVETESGV